MSLNNIELEFRAEVNQGQYFLLLTKLKREAKLISHTKRLSVMYFGKVKNTLFDIRIRVTNGQPELVIKKGALHAPDRVESSCPIMRSQFIELVRLFVLFTFKSEVAERETFNFDMGNKIIFSLVKANGIMYVEVEKLSSKDSIIKNKLQILKVLNHYNLTPMTKVNDFNKLCNRLSKYSDWPFTGSMGDFRKLEKILARY